MALLFLYGSPAFALTSHVKRIAPPGNSGVTEYQEDVPTAGGGNPVPNAGTLVVQPGVLSPTVTRQLDAAGKPGRSTALLAAATAPATHYGRRAATLRRQLHSQGDDVLGSLSSSLGGSNGGLGALLPILLVASLLIAAMLALARRQRS